MKIIIIILSIVLGVVAQAQEIYSGNWIAQGNCPIGDRLSVHDTVDAYINITPSKTAGDLNDVLLRKYKTGWSFGTGWGYDEGANLNTFQKTEVNGKTTTINFYTRPPSGGSKDLTLVRTILMDLQDTKIMTVNDSKFGTCQFKLDPNYVAFALKKFTDLFINSFNAADSDVDMISEVQGLKFAREFLVKNYFLSYSDQDSFLSELERKSLERWVINEKAGDSFVAYYFYHYAISLSETRALLNSDQSSIGRFISDDAAYKTIAAFEKLEPSIRKKFAFNIISRKTKSFNQDISSGGEIAAHDVLLKALLLYHRDDLFFEMFPYTSTYDNIQKYSLTKVFIRSQRLDLLEDALSNHMDSKLYFGKCDGSNNRNENCGVQDAYQTLYSFTKDPEFVIAALKVFFKHGYLKTYGYYESTLIGDYVNMIISGGYRKMSEGWKKIVQYLISEGADINANEGTALALFMHGIYSFNLNEGQQFIDDLQYMLTTLHANPNSGDIAWDRTFYGYDIGNNPAFILISHFSRTEFTRIDADSFVLKILQVLKNAGYNASAAPFISNFDNVEFGPAYLCEHVKKWEKAPNYKWGRHVDYLKKSLDFLGCEISP